MAEFSRKHKFADWPNPEVPAVAVGVYAVWKDETLIYCGMSGREFEKATRSARVKVGLVAGLASHASGRLTGHKTRSVFDRYHIVNEADLRDAAAKLNRSERPTGTVVPIRRAAADGARPK
jgi:hypothetical protein